MAGLPSSIQPSEHQDPEWGVFPAEQYLIRRWDQASALDPNEQRLRLVRAFTQTDFGAPDTCPSPAPRAPTEAEIRDILEPWRPQKLRRVAYMMRLGNLGDEMSILRTYYGEGSDDLLEEVLEEEELSNMHVSPDSRWWRVLDDADLFGGLADDWAPVLDILPELVGHLRLEPPKRMDLTRDEVVDLVEKYEDRELDPMTGVHQRACQSGWPLLVADQEALEDHALQCLWLDGFGNVVRESFIETTQIGMFMSLVDRQSTWETQPCWENPDEDPWRVKVGCKYKPGGEMALRLYPTHLARKGAK